MVINHGEYIDDRKYVGKNVIQTLNPATESHQDFPQVTYLLRAMFKRPSEAKKHIKFFIPQVVMMMNAERDYRLAGIYLEKSPILRFFPSLTPSVTQMIAQLASEFVAEIIAYYALANRPPAHNYVLWLANRSLIPTCPNKDSTDHQGVVAQKPEAAYVNNMKLDLQSEAHRTTCYNYYSNIKGWTDSILHVTGRLLLEFLHVPVRANGNAVAAIGANNDLCSDEMWTTHGDLCKELVFSTEATPNMLLRDFKNVL